MSESDLTEAPEKMGYFTKPVVKKVPPMRKQIISNFQRDVKAGKLSVKNLPRFIKKFNEGNLSPSHLLNKDKMIADPEELKKYKHQGLQSPHFKDLYQVLKKGT